MGQNNSSDSRKPAKPSNKYKGQQLSGTSRPTAVNPLNVNRPIFTPLAESPLNVNRQINTQSRVGRTGDSTICKSQSQATIQIQPKALHRTNPLGVSGSRSINPDGTTSTSHTPSVPGRNPFVQSQKKPEYIPITTFVPTPNILSDNCNKTSIQANNQTNLLGVSGSRSINPDGTTSTSHTPSVPGRNPFVQSQKKPEYIPSTTFVPTQNVLSDNRNKTTIQGNDVGLNPVNLNATTSKQYRNRNRRGSLSKNDQDPVTREPSASITNSGKKMSGRFPNTARRGGNPARGGRSFENWSRGNHSNMNRNFHNVVPGVSGATPQHYMPMHMRGRNDNSLSNHSSLENINLDDNSNRGQRNARGRGRGHARQDQSQRGGMFGFKKLEELLLKTPEEALMTLINNIDKVINYFYSNETPDVLVLLLEVFSNVINASFAESVSKLLLTIVKSNYFEPVKKYIMELPIADSAVKNRGRRFWNNPEKFFLNVALTLDAMLEVLPSSGMDIAPGMIDAILYTMPNIEQRHSGVTFSDEVKTSFEDLQLKIVSITEREERRKRKKEHDQFVEEEEAPPPNDFHDIDVYPNALEITTRTPTYLRKNVIDGAYQNVHHYLDVQYRLLREDFVAPLRDGICEYFDMVRDGHPKGKQKLSNIKIYKEVLCLGVVPNVNQVGYLVQAFKPKTIKNLENSRRFMFGSLVCLTPDNFTTIIFGKIIDRDKKYLIEGRLVLGFDVGVELDLNRKYIMVECTIYFEPYYQVLTALKQMNENMFPFKEYLVDVRVDPERPDYLQEGVHVDIDCERGELNPSQLEAYHAAMTRKFCIIQGPPGTGKTYLALKVARRLLERKSVWQTSPMLVICYTNHALDQFLEGLLDTTQNLVRVGGQCKNEKLSKLNLRNLRVKSVPADYFHAQRMSKSEVESCSRLLSRYGGILMNINEYASVIRFEAFDDDEVEPQFAGSWFDTASDADLLKWLLYQPNNGNEVKFADYEMVTQMIHDLKLQNQQNADDAAAAEDEDAEETTDNPYGQIRQNQLDIDYDEDLEVRYDPTEHDLFNVHKTNQAIAQLAKKLREMGQAGLENSIEFLTAMHKMIKMRIDYDYVCQKLRMLKNQEGHPDPNIYVDFHNPRLMPANDRWRQYGVWLRRYKRIVQEKYIETDQEYRQLYAKFTEVKDMLDLYKLKHVDVVGMTTTGAARLHKTLQALACPIVIVEEAAEVLEAHIITALSPSCQHLILIGDHKQLKPSTADYKITREYNLGVSLFERMVRNGLHCYSLDVQHRMRPEIANLVCPSIYPVLHNHESVELYPPISGVDAPLYFITHEHQERESNDRSKENIFEAEYLIRLARYLVLNNYDASRITIIAAYSGQWFVLRELKKKYHILRDMRICILDNFQGEENDIILLSLVRNNPDGVVGFLHLENRICVALSRAKHGMYIMGNITQLCNSSPIWRQVEGVLKKYDALGSYLTVRCVNHPDYVTHLRDVEDFEKVPEGGCLKICDKPLACGHSCTKVCHNTRHEDVQCYQPCQRVLCEFGHVCPAKCYQECGKCKVPKFATLPCGHSRNIFCHQSPEEVECCVLVATTLPCGHSADKPCHADPQRFTCPHPCDARVEPCGHSCKLDCHIHNDPNHENYKCSKQCVKMNIGCSMGKEFKHKCEKRCYEPCDKCRVEVKKQRNCEHFFDVPCHADVQDVVCKKPCKRKLPCGHNCPKRCDEPCGSCKIKVKKVIPECGHDIIWECGAYPNKSNCRHKTCPLMLSCGHPCPLPCANLCSTAKCMQLVPSPLHSPCGHQLTVPCHLKHVTDFSNELLAHCSAKCHATLQCGHTCPGTCGQCAQGRFHVPCAEKCDKTLVCGHGCKTPCVQNCAPCLLECQYRCEHSKCTKQCGAPCTRCNEPCNRQCIHQRCNFVCGKICDIKPCQEPCAEMLDCGHPCVGFCGDICPPLCRVCNAEELSEIIFGTEEDEDARFVYLADCNHTLESTGLDRWFGAEEDVSEVKVPRCPKCNTIVNVPRYRNYIKDAHKTLQMIKREYFGHPKELTELLSLLKADIDQMIMMYPHKVCQQVVNFLRLSIRITGTGRKRQDQSKANLVSLRARLDLFQGLTKIRYATDGSDPLVSSSAKQLVDDHLNFLFSKLVAPQVSINEQQIHEFQMEIKRFNRINQLAKALEVNSNAKTFKEYSDCHKKIETFRKYDTQQDARVHEAMEALHKAAQTRLAITDVERKEIVAAIQLGRGHWFKCGNGHIYAIGECGGAMEVAKCPECGLTIGGRSHQLTTGNQLASEMDGATRPAYPTINNIGMYQL